ncbi:hypothetical protein P4H66_02670 [Paenibacillus dokdonensis]|uniref:Sporulation membrane protein YtrI C-terminal domain-containing protein n=1 Tax=Paenibacillus dokdonensis TaxID=2567944 RepID=A0ABU6GGB7_9BACL|nr:hypothetical protein [Paenibacillus dokdonensis]MEC0238776.1 hypothetical protein [Paenibacillus dokdonensis]
MRIPPFKRYRHISQIAAVFVLGAIIGSVVYNVVFHTSYNILWLSNLDLESQIKQYEEDIKTLKNYKNQQTVIREIKIRNERQDPPIDPVVVKAIIVQLSEDLGVLRGQNVFEIDTYSKVVRTLLEEKIYKVREKEYSVEIKTMLLMEGMLQIWVDVHTVQVRNP